MEELTNVKSKAGRKKGSLNGRHYRTCRICGKRFLVEVTSTDKRPHTYTCPDCDEYKRYKIDAIDAAEDLGYPPECIDRLRGADNSVEISRIMHTYRDRLYGYH